MFIGDFKHTLDAKGRVFMPAKFRDELAEGLVLTIGLDKCISVYTKEEFSRFREKLDATSITNKQARDFSRFFYGNACECELDKQGRITLPSNLIDYAKIEKNITVVGISTRIELWSTEKWEDEHNIENVCMEDLAENMAQYGL